MEGNFGAISGSSNFDACWFRRGGKTREVSGFRECAGRSTGTEVKADAVFAFHMFAALWTGTKGKSGAASAFRDFDEF